MTGGPSAITLRRAGGKELAQGSHSFTVKLLLPREVGGNASFRVPFPRRPRVHRTSFVHGRVAELVDAQAIGACQTATQLRTSSSGLRAGGHTADLTSLAGSSPAPTTFSSDHQDVPTRIPSPGSQVQVLSFGRKIGSSSVGRAWASKRGNSRHFHSVGRLLFISGSTLSCMRQRWPPFGGLNGRRACNPSPLGLHSGGRSSTTWGRIRFDGVLRWEPGVAGVVPSLNGAQA